MAHPSDCYAALCNIRTIIVEQLGLLGYPIDANDCRHKCLTELVNTYASYTGCTYTVDNLEKFMNDTVPSEEWHNKVVECDGHFAVCIEAVPGEYLWTTLEEAATLIEHTIKSDGTYEASDFAADGFSKIIVDTSAQRNLQNKTVKPSSKLQVVTADASFAGLGTVTVTAVNARPLRVTANKDEQVVTPEEGFYDKVTVEAIKNQANVKVTPGTYDKTVTYDNGYDGLENVIVKGDTNLLPEHIVSGVTIFGTVGKAGVSSDGKPIDIATEEEMNLRRSAASASTAGTLYRYTGPNGAYIKNSLYVVTTSAPYALERIECMLMTLDDTLITINGSTITWKPVPFAKHYYVLNGGATLDIVTSTSYTLDIDEPGIYDIRVAAYAPGYLAGDSNTIVYYVGKTVVNKTKTISFPVGNTKSIATTFNDKATFICSNYSSSTSTILEYDKDEVYGIRGTPALFHAVASTPDYMFLATDDAIYAYDTDNVYTIISDVFDENTCKAGVAFNNYGLFDVGWSSIIAIDNTLTTHEIMYDTPGEGFNDWYEPCVDRCACSNDKYAIFGGGRFGYPDSDIYYGATATETTTFTDRVPGVTIVDTDLVSSSLNYATSTLSAGAAATTVGPYIVLAGGKINTYTAKYGYVTHDINEGPVYTYLGHDLKSSAYSRAVEAIDRDLVSTKLIFARYFNNACATTLGSYAIFSGGENLKDGVYFDKTTSVSSDLVITDTDDLCVARSNISAATLFDKAIFAGGGSAVSSDADVYSISIAYE